jgi:hypothetical protein
VPHLLNALTFDRTDGRQQAIKARSLRTPRGANNARTPA